MRHLAALRTLGAGARILRNEAGSARLLSRRTQCESAVEDGGLLAVVEVGAEVADSLELEAVAGFCLCEAGRGFFSLF